MTHSVKSALASGLNRARPAVARVDVNTRMVQSILHNPDVTARLSPEHYRALTPLIYLYINHYGRFEIDPLIQIDL